MKESVFSPPAANARFDTSISPKAARKPTAGFYAETPAGVKVHSFNIPVQYAEKTVQLNKPCTKKYKKGVMFVLLLAVLLSLISRYAAAEGPINPRRSHVEETLQLRDQSQPILQIFRFLSGDPSLRITTGNEPTLSSPGQFSVSIINDDGNNGSDWWFEYGIQDVNRDPNGYVYYSGEKTTSRTFNDFMFCTEGSYKLWVTLYRNKTDLAENAIARTSFSFTVEGDGAHMTLEEKIQEIAESCKVQGNDWQTALNLHDWLTHHMYYDKSYEYYGAEAIFRGKGVCDAYSKAYKMLCDEAGITVGRVSSRAGNHAWNAIQLNGEWYQVDVTWDDPTENPPVLEAVSGKERHDYFCLNDEIMFLDHVASDASFKPGCTSMVENYAIKTETWEQHTVYLSNGTKVKDYFLNQIDSGDTRPTLMTVGENGWRYYWTGNHGTGMSTALYATCVYALNQSDWSLDDGGAIRVEVEYNRADNLVEARMLGWDLEETGTLIIPAGVTAVPDEMLRGTRGTTAVIPEGCLSIGEYAFAGSQVRTLIIPAALSSIDGHAFDNCGRILFVLADDNEAVEDYADENGYLVTKP